MPEKRATRQNPEIRRFILENISEYPRDIVRHTIDEFGLSRTAVNKYLRRLVEEGILESEGNTRARCYKVREIVEVIFSLENITRNSSESAVWQFRILPEIRELSRNVLDICHYGFTEILNNVIDHSLSGDAVISFRQNIHRVEMAIVDHGIGIFEKIKNDFNLPDARSALLELSKGKITSDKRRHAGEGIFFTSRMFDEFHIKSGSLFYSRTRTDDDDWLIEVDEEENFKGTAIFMTISIGANWTMREVFDRYQDDKLRFRRTHVPIKLGAYPGELLVSRSQAKRVLARFDQFSEIILDFEGVEDIGQAFADEIFRVYRQDHPEIDIIPIHTSTLVQKMIIHVLSERTDDFQLPLFC